LQIEIKRRPRRVLEYEVRGVSSAVISANPMTHEAAHRKQTLQRTYPTSNIEFVIMKDPYSHLHQQHRNASLSAPKKPLKIVA
jgi:hypothetical protein